MIHQTLTSLTKMTSSIEHKFDAKLKSKYDLVIRRIENTNDKKDALVLFEGDEGEGKTNHSVCFADYVAQETGREFNNKSVRFQAEEIINEAKHTKGRIFIWDEPALQGLKKLWWNKAQIHLTQLLMMARKNRHLFIFNVADFSKFNEYIIRRAIFMIRIYTRNEKEKKRRFLYFPRKKLRAMWENYQSKRKRQYFKFHTFHGTMNDGYLLPQIIDENIYENDKDNAIRSIGEEEKSGNNKFQKDYETVLKFAYTTQFPFTITSLSHFAELVLKKPASTLTRGKKMAEKRGLIPKSESEKFALCDLQALIIHKGTDGIEELEEPIVGGASTS